MEDYEYVDQWGDKWVCIHVIGGERCRSDTFFYLEHPDSLEVAAFCTRCKNPFDNLMQEHIVNGALDGTPVPPEKKLSRAEYLRRDMIESSQELEREREEYAKVQKNWPDGKAKELMLQTIKEHGEFLAGYVADRKDQIRKVLIHGR